jgi:hypothetical protein
MFPITTLLRYNVNLPFDLKDVGVLYTTLLNTISTGEADGTNSFLCAIVMQAIDNLKSTTPKFDVTKEFLP